MAENGDSSLEIVASSLDSSASIVSKRCYNRGFMVRPILV